MGYFFLACKLLFYNGKYLNILGKECFVMGKTIKKVIKGAAVFLVGSLFFSAQGMADTYTIGGGATDVGEIDLFAWECTNLTNSGASEEAECFNEYLTDIGSSQVVLTTEISQLVPPTDGAFIEVDGNPGDVDYDVWALDIGADYTGGFFLIKLGNVEGGTHSLIFENNNLTSFAVINLATILMLEGGIEFAIPNIDKISHISLAAVPLPPAVIAFASAMFGIGFLGRRKKKVAIEQL